MKAKFAGDIFPQNKEEAKKLYREMAKKWHPDINKTPNANEVFAKLTELYDKAMNLDENGVYLKSDTILFKSIQGKTHKISFNSENAFELGKIYTADSVIVYVLEKKHKTFFDNALNQIKKLKYFNDEMKKEFEKYMPTIIDSFETKDSFVLILKKTKDLYLLKDVLNYFDGKLPHRHVAWIMGSLYNIVCFFNYNNISHNSISIDNYLISPLFHSGLIAGGWWYTVNQDEKMIGVKKETFMIMPNKSKNSKTASIKTDLESIRLIGRQLLGNPSGNIVDSDVPLPFLQWLKGTSSNNPYEEYSLWQKVLDKSYGKREFIELKIDKNTFYKKLKEEIKNG